MELNRNIGASHTLSRQNMLHLGLTLTLLCMLSLPTTALGRARFSRSKSHPPHLVCKQLRATRARCLTIQVPTVAAGSPNTTGPSFEGTGELGGLSPSDLRSAYKLPESGGSGQTVAIVDAYNDPNANADLAKYRETYGLSPCTEASGCFKKVNHLGETSKYPEANSEWAVEMSLDLDMASAACPQCHILLVEASSNATTAMVEAENEAVTQGATEVSNSWDSSEFAGETSDDTDFNHPGIPITVAAGDNGYGVSYPAASPYVISVGGTALRKAPETARGWTEEAWRNTELSVGERGAGTGSGCSVYETSKPSWQHDGSCAHRTDNDIAAVASASTPVSVYDSYESSGWIDVAGTSVAAPIIAAIEAHANAETRSAGAKIFYESPDSVFDVTTGNDGLCSGSYLCTAEVGYDGPTGLGSPDGIPHLYPAAPGASLTAVRDPSNEEQGTFYVDSSEELGVWGFSNATGWENYHLAGAIRSGTNPTAVNEAKANETMVFTVNTSGEIVDWWYHHNSWSSHVTLGGSVRPGTSPTAIVSESNEAFVVYYVNTAGEIAYFANIEETGWFGGTLGGSVRTGTSPAATFDPSTGDVLVYYVNTSGELAAWGLNASTESWTNMTIGGSVRSNTNPAVAASFTSGEAIVYYVNTSGEVALEYYAAGWKGGTLGGSVETGTTPAVIHDPSTALQVVDYVNPSDELDYWIFTGSWASGAIGSKTQTGSSPALLYDPTTKDQWLYYIGEEANIWTWTYVGGVLSNSKLG